MNLYRMECVLLCRGSDVSEVMSEFNDAMKLLAPFGLIEDVHVESVEEMESEDD